MRRESNIALPGALGIVFLIKRQNSLIAQVNVKDQTKYVTLKSISGPAAWSHRAQAFDGILADEQNKYLDQIRQYFADQYRRLWEKGEVTAEMLVQAYKLEHPDVEADDEKQARYIEKKRELTKALDKLIESKPRRTKDRLEFYYEKLAKLNKQLEDLEFEHKREERSEKAKAVAQARTAPSRPHQTKPLSIIFLSRRVRTNKAGLCPIYCKVTVAGVKANEFSTGVYAAPEKWDGTYKAIIGDEEGTAKLAAMKAALTAVYEEFRKRGKIPAPQEVINHYFDSSLDFDKRWKLEDLIDKHLKELRIRKRSRSTINRHERVAKYFQEYTRVQYVEDVEKHHVRGFRTWLIDSKGASNDYANKCVQGVIGLMATAVSYDVIKTNPATGLRLEWERTLDTTCLDAEELGLLRTTQWSERLQKVVDSFLFMCYTGLHICDYRNLNGTHLKTSYGTKFIEFSRQKTKSPALVPLSPAAVEIIKKYGSIEQLPRLSGQKSNDYLKLVAEQIGTDKTLTNKVARKTFTDMSINQRGMSFEAVASMLGHTSTKFIRAYGRVNHMRILNEWRD